MHFVTHGEIMIDRIDNEILKILMENSRTPFIHISKLLKVSEATIRKRVGDLEKDGVIKKYCTQVDPNKAGLGSVAIVGIDVKPEKFLEVAKKLTEFENITSVATTTGDHMIMTEIWMDNPKELRNFINEKIERIDGIIRTCPAILTEKLKG